TSAQNSPVPSQGVSPRFRVATCAPASSLTAIWLPASWHPAEHFAPTLILKGRPVTARGGTSQTGRLGRGSGCSSGFRRGSRACDVTRHQTLRQNMHRESAGGLARAVQSGDHARIAIHHLIFRIHANSGERIVENRRRPGRVERRFLDLV